MIGKILESLIKEQDDICRSIKRAEAKPNVTEQELSNLKEKLKMKTKLIEIVEEYRDRRTACKMPGGSDVIEL